MLCLSQHGEEGGGSNARFAQGTICWQSGVCVYVCIYACVYTLTPGQRKKGTADFLKTPTVKLTFKMKKGTAYLLCALPFEQQISSLVFQAFSITVLA